MVLLISGKSISKLMLATWNSHQVLKRCSAASQLVKKIPSLSFLCMYLNKLNECVVTGQCGSHNAPGREGLSESRLIDILHGSEYVLTYEDKDGDWMLVGDVPWK